MRKNDWRFCLFLPLAKSHVQQTKPLLPAEIMRNFMRTAPKGHIHFQKNKNSQLFEKLNDVDIMSMLMLAAYKVIKMEQITLCMRYHDSAFVLWQRVAKFCENFSQKQKFWFLLLSNAYDYNINAYVCNI